MNTGLFFGSFNPIHLGHMVIAGYMLEFTDIEEVWFVVSPQNPLKDESGLAPEEHRLKMVQLAVEEYYPKMQVCDIEMSMPRPSYTIDTLEALQLKHLDRQFTVILGSDSMDTITKWKNYKELIQNYNIYVYPRLGSKIEELMKKYSAQFIPAPVVDISSTFIRNSISEEKDVSHFIPKKVFHYIKNHQLY